MLQVTTDSWPLDCRTVKLSLYVVSWRNLWLSLTWYQPLLHISAATKTTDQQVNIEMHPDLIQCAASEAFFMNPKAYQTLCYLSCNPWICIQRPDVRLCLSARSLVFICFIRRPYSAIFEGDIPYMFKFCLPALHHGIACSSAALQFWLSPPPANWNADSSREKCLRCKW